MRRSFSIIGWLGTLELELKWQIDFRDQSNSTLHKEQGIRNEIAA